VRILRTFFLVVLCVLATTLCVGHRGSAATKRVVAPADAEIVRVIRHYRVTTRRLQHVMGGPAVKLNPVSHASLERARAVWRRRVVVTRRHFLAGPPHRRAWLCIHRYEGAWSDRGAPYYGGLQMDLVFQARYGGLLLRVKGTADNWTPLEQMWIAEKAFRAGRGFYPWPNTARYCGLI